MPPRALLGHGVQRGVHSPRFRVVQKVRGSCPRASKKPSPTHAVQTMTDAAPILFGFRAVRNVQGSPPCSEALSGVRGSPQCSEVLSGGSSSKNDFHVAVFLVPTYCAQYGVELWITFECSILLGFRAV